MGFYERRIFPWLNDRFTSNPDVEELRAEVLTAARGDVLEIGFGTGLTLRHYSSEVRRVIAVEPNSGMVARAIPRIDASRVPVSVMLGAGERLPLRDKTVDAATLILTLCSVANPEIVLRELGRVLKPGAPLMLVEHGASDDPKVAKWQRRLNRMQNVLACGCNLDRDVMALLAQAGFTFERLRQFYAPKAPRTHGFMTVGVAVAQ